MKNNTTIAHVVMWNLKNSADANHVKQLVESCSHVVPGTITFQVGIKTEGLEANADVVLYSVFKDKASLQAYQNHPQHEAIKPQIAALRSGRTVLDYEI